MIETDITISTHIHNDALSAVEVWRELKLWVQLPPHIVQIGITLRCATPYTLRAATWML